MLVSVQLSPRPASHLELDALVINGATKSQDAPVKATDLVLQQEAL
jgi:hypothetical protein